MSPLQLLAALEGIIIIFTLVIIYKIGYKGACAKQMLRALEQQLIEEMADCEVKKKECKTKTGPIVFEGKRLGLERALSLVSIALRQLNWN